MSDFNDYNKKVLAQANQDKSFERRKLSTMLLRALGDLRTYKLLHPEDKLDLGYIERLICTLRNEDPYES